MLYVPTRTFRHCARIAELLRADVVDFGGFLSCVCLLCVCFKTPPLSLFSLCGVAAHGCMCSFTHNSSHNARAFPAGGPQIHSHQHSRRVSCVLFTCRVDAHLSPALRQNGEKPRGGLGARVCVHFYCHSLRMKCVACCVCCVRYLYIHSGSNKKNERKKKEIGNTANRERG